MSQNEKNNKKQEKGKESENHFYSHLNKIYKEINDQGEIYTEGFTPEQIFYQIEEVSEKIFKEANEKINLKNENIKEEDEVKVKEGEQVHEEDKDDGKIDEDYEDGSEQVHEEDKNIEDDYEDDDDQENMNDSNDDVDDPSPLVIENEGTDYSDCSSVDEGTYSEDSTPFDPEEMKSKPASELFKTLDKNIRKK